METEAAPGTLHKRILLWFLYAAYLLVIVELGCRAYWKLGEQVPFFDTREILLSFYPELKPVVQREIARRDGYFDILILGGSVIGEKFGKIGPLLAEELTTRSGAKVRVHNLAVAAHTSLDSYYKYEYLSDKSFDLVVFYHAINEARANNCPPELFRDDYSHYGWYSLINQLRDHREVEWLSFPYTFTNVWLRVERYFNLVEYVPTHGPKPEWIEYGADIKTAAPFRRNLLSVFEIARRRDERVLAMTFALHPIEGYEQTMTVWGTATNVAAAVKAHNAIVRTESAKHSHVSFVDQNERMLPDERRIFFDLCHFTPQGCEKFVDNMLETVLAIIESSDDGG